MMDGGVEGSWSYAGEVRIIERQMGRAGRLGITSVGLDQAEGRGADGMDGGM
jgi:hypothetical protein